MNQPLDCHVYYDSTRHAEPPAGCGHRVDLAAQPQAASRLTGLGISPESDLPALLLTEPDGSVRIAGVRLSPEEASGLAAGLGIQTHDLVVYSSAWCPDCRRTKHVLENAAAPFAEVDIDRDAGAEAMVLQRSGGRRVVPTLRFGERVWAFNPPAPLLRRLLGGGGRAAKAV
jgi:glutaredoxin